MKYQIWSFGRAFGIPYRGGVISIPPSSFIETEDEALASAARGMPGLSVVVVNAVQTEPAKPQRRAVKKKTNEARERRL